MMNKAASNPQGVLLSLKLLGWTGCLLLTWIFACAGPVTAPTSADQVEELLRAGTDLYEKGDYPSALAKFNAALERSASIDNQTGAADALNNIGMVQLRQRNNEEALQNFSRALDINRELKRNAEMASTILNIGAVYATLHNTAKAEAQYRKALEIARKSKLKSLEAKSLNNLGLLMKQTGDTA